MGQPAVPALEDHLQLVTVHTLFHEFLLRDHEGHPWYTRVLRPDGHQVSGRMIGLHDGRNVTIVVDHLEETLAGGKPGPIHPIDEELSYPLPNDPHQAPEGVVLMIQATSTGFELMRCDPDGQLVQEEGAFRVVVTAPTAGNNDEVKVWEYRQILDYLRGLLSKIKKIPMADINDSDRAYTDTMFLLEAAVDHFGIPAYEFDDARDDEATLDQLASRLQEALRPTSTDERVDGEDVHA